jgi:hypothetical protein
MIYPDVVSDSPDYLAFTERLAKRLSSTFKPAVDDTGVAGPNAIAGDFLQLLTVPGYQMSQLSVPPVDNTLIRQELGLVEDFVSPRHRQIAEVLFDAMFSDAAPSKVSIRRQASTGSPDYVNDVPKKKSELRLALENIDDFLNLIDNDDLEGLYERFNATIVQTIGQRVQADKVTCDGDKCSSKDREVNDELAARTGLREGKREPASKRVVINGATVKNHFAGRRRTVFGMSFVPNYVMATFFSMFRAVYLDRYAFTWKHRTSDSILEKMRRYKFLAGFDVKQFDQTVPRFLIDLFAQRIGDRTDPRFGKLTRLMFSAPFVMPYPWVEGASDAQFDPLFGTDPFVTATFKFNMGLPSGISCNPDMGKFVMMFQYLVIADDFFHNVLEVGVDTILRGEHDEYAFLNMGDDCVVLSNNEQFNIYVNETRYEAQYFSVTKESPISFLGNVPYRDDRGELQLAPNIISFFVNWLVPEHGIDSYQRRNFWAIGDRERRQHYARAPSYPEAYSIFEEEFQATYGRTPSSITAQYYESQKGLGALSTIDALVLQNPDYLQYRYDEKDVSQEVLDMITTSIPADEAWGYVSHFFNKH